MSEITNNDYTLVENDASFYAEFYGVKYTTGKYKNVVVVYGKVNVIEDEVNDTAKLSFTYAIQDPADYDIAELEKDEDFGEHMGNVLTHFIAESLENKEAQIGTIESPIDIDPESFTE